MRRLLTLLLLLAACGAETAETTSSPALDPPSTTTTVITTTSDTAVAREPAVLSAGRTVVLEPGSEYVVDGFAVPLSFRIENEGWRWYGVADVWAYLGWVSDGELAAAVAIVAYRSSLPPEEVAEAILSIDGVDVANGAASVAIGGLEAVTLDVEGAPERAQVGEQRCTPGFGRFFLDQPGYALVVESGSTNPKEYGIAACNVSRVWVAEAEGQSITVIGGATDPDRFEELIPVVERLVGSLAFEAP